MGDVDEEEKLDVASAVTQPYSLGVILLDPSSGNPNTCEIASATRRESGKTKRID